MQGKETATLYKGEAQANQAYELEWQPGMQQAAGMYIIRLYVNKEVTFKKIILVK